MASQTKTDVVFSKYANQALPKRAALVAGLEAYSGAWDKRHAMHLLRRSMFGFTQADLTKAMALNAATCVDALLDIIDEVIPPPVVIETTDALPVGQTWVTATYDGNLNGQRGRSLQAWWLGLIAGQKFSIREKMVLFWHNSLPSEIDAVGDPRLSYIQNVLLRKYALGNFKDLIKQITLDPAMLRYLNGNTNTNKNPNENYGRELQELFTVGKGPEISAGNYTNYTEDDVKTAARVLTGWQDDRTNLTSVFQDKLHDITDKVFSSAYGGTVIKGRAGIDGALEVDDLVDMIFQQTETARYLCRKLYRFFVYYAIDASVEKNIITPMADMLKTNGFVLKPVIAALLKSAHFHDALNMGCAIKTPLDMVVGAFRQLNASVPAGTDPVSQYAFWNVMMGEASRMQQEIGNPPNVAGWPAYYQDPVYYELWINSDTLPRRLQLTDRMIGTKGYTYASNTLASIVDPLALAQTTSKPGTVATLVAELSEVFFPITLTDLQLKYLKDVMMVGLPDYEWGVEWDDYLAAPTDIKLRSAVENRLRSLLKAMMQLAEYQLC
jgi:uncharacterized protein (DUF1800 family)